MNNQQTQKTDIQILTENQDILGDIVKITELKQQENKLSDYLISQADELWTIAAQTLKMTDRERYLHRLAKTIATDTNLERCFDSLPGKMSIIHAMQKAIELGVMPGEDAYIIPYKKGKYVDRQWTEVYIANLQLRAEAYMKICMSEPNPLFKQITHGLVYENDNLEIDEGQGIVKHPINHKEDRGELCGVWIKLTPINTSLDNIVKYWGIKRIYKVRDTHSPTWEQYLESSKLYADCEAGKVKGAVKQANGNYKVPGAGYKGKDKYVKNPEKSTNSWITDEEQMIIKTILKGELKRFALMKPGLETAISYEEKPVESEDDKTESETDKLLNNNVDHLENSKSQKDEQPEQSDPDKDFFDNIDEVS